MLYLALVNGLTAKQASAKIVSLVLAGLIVILSISGMVAYKSMAYMGDKMMQKMEEVSKDSAEAQKKVEGMMEQLKKQLEEAQKKK
jgi:hypothetical protein